MRMELKSGFSVKGLNQMQLKTGTTVRCVMTINEAFVCVEGRASFATVSRCVASSQLVLVGGDTVVSFPMVRKIAGKVAFCVIGGGPRPGGKGDQFLGMLEKFAESFSEAIALEGLIAVIHITIGMMIGENVQGNGDVVGTGIGALEDARTHHGGNPCDLEGVSGDQVATWIGEHLDVRYATIISVEDVIAVGRVNTVTMCQDVRFVASSSVVLVVEEQHVNMTIRCRRCVMISPEASAIVAPIANTPTLVQKSVTAGGQHARFVKTTRGVTALAEKAANTRMT